METDPVSETLCSLVTLRFQRFNQITSLDTLIVIVEMLLASLLWERVYLAVA
jgi:hypothetical protein